MFIFYRNWFQGRGNVLKLEVKIMEEKYIGISIKPNEDDTLEHK